MRHTNCLILFLLAFQAVCFGNPTKNGQQSIYAYKGETQVGLTIQNNLLTKWTISGKLTVQEFSKYMIFQLDDVKTSIFNGKPEDVKLAEQKEISEEAKVLTKPFVVHQNENNILSIDVTPDEPLWAINMKRSIGYHFQIQFDNVLNNEESLIKSTEQSYYGDCNVLFKKDSSAGDIKLIKKIYPIECKNSPFKIMSNAKRADATLDYEPLHMETIKSYTLKKEQEHLSISETFSTSNITYNLLPSAKIAQYVLQNQEFKLLYNDPKIDDIIETKENTKNMEIKYDFDIQSVYPRAKKNYSTNELIKQFIENYEKFDKKFNTVANNFKIRDEDNIDNMYLALYDMKENEIDELCKEIFEKRNDASSYFILSMLPFIGTNHSTKFIANKLDKIWTFQTNEFLALKLLAAFPTHIQEPTEEIIESLEFMLNFQKLEGDALITAGRLSFASALTSAFNKNLISKNKFEKYKSMLYNGFLGGENYQERMSYLLSLINIAEGLNTDFIISILTNTSEINHLRALGITGFKSMLLGEPEKIFEHFWPIVLNKTEPFDVRVASLDLLLSVNLSEEHFNTIVEESLKAPTDIDDIHLNHYFHTTILTLQNTTMYQDPLGERATELLEKGSLANFNLYSHARTTANYRIAYTDDKPNFGRKLQLRLVGNPVTNSLNTLHLSYNNFFMSFDMGNYGLYIKLDNVPEMIYKNNVLKKLAEKDIAIPELIELLKEFDFTMKSEKVFFHAEIVVFIDERVVFALHVHPENFGEIKTFFESFTVLSNPEQHVSYPLMDYTMIPSDLGTPVKIMNDVQDINGFELLRYEYLSLKNSWYFQTWMESYNPLAETSISSYKYLGDEKSANLTLHLNLDNSNIVWTHWNESFNYVWDNLGGIVVEDENILKEYCAECNSIWEIPDGEFVYEFERYNFVAINLNCTREITNGSDLSDNYIMNILEDHYSNINTLPFAKPVLLFLHYGDYQTYFFGDQQRGTCRSMSSFQNKAKTLLKIRNNNKSKILNPLITSDYKNFSIEISSSEFTNEYVENFYNFTYTQQTTAKNINETPEPKIAQTYTIDSEFIRYNKSRTKIYIFREVIYPNISKDKFTILPPEPAAGNIDIYFCQNRENSEECQLSRKFELSEKLRISDKLRDKVISSKNYKKCTEQRNELMYTPATKECIVGSHRLLNQYDNYEMRIEFFNRSSLNHEDISKYPFILASMVSDNKYDISLSKIPWCCETSDNNEIYFNFTIIYPYVGVSPNLIAFNDYEIITGIRRSCIISPKIIKTLTYDIIQYDEKKPVAMIECLKKTLRGLKTKKIGDKHIGFKMWAENNTLTATFNENKLEVKVNGNIISEDYHDQENNFYVKFLDENVILVKEEEIRIYYNTEYIFTDVASEYSNRLCGFCTHE